MGEAAWIIAGFSAALLVAAIAVWVKTLRGPLLQRLDGRRVQSNSGQDELASRLLVLAVSLSAVAAVLAVASWIIT
jgi:hypothetical protein